uniref:Small acidic protein-like domain-containing protein n=1 Tax=Setaria digitata TaxID=48799 RepID=A0A915Q118_9BILA
MLQIGSYMADGSFRSLTAKEIRKHIERRSEDKQEKQKKRRSDEEDDREKSDNVIRKKCYEDDRSHDRKYGREKRGRSVERHSDSRHRGDKHHDRGRGPDSIVRERSSELGYSRDRSRDQYSNKEREDRVDRRGHHHKESDSKEHRNSKLSHERGGGIRKSRSSRRYSPVDNEDGNSDRPAWATKAVVKRAEEIQKRKLIWSKPEEKKELECNTTPSPTSLRPSSTSTWNSILAASSSDSKQLDNLMGMKKSDEEGQEKVPEVDDNQVEAERRRQRELYSHLDHQYAVARSFTHLSRGQGLGFHQ